MPLYPLPFNGGSSGPTYLPSGVQLTAPGGTSKDPFIPAFTLPARFKSRIPLLSPVMADGHEKIFELC
jgi:hypothetical protein